MPLDFQLIDIPFTGGIDTKTDPKLLPPAKLLELENARFSEKGTLSKRLGTVAMTDLTYNSVTLGTTQALGTFKEELLRWTTTGLFRYSPTISRWMNVANATETQQLRYVRSEVVRRGESQDAFATASLGGVTVYVWTEAENDSKRMLRSTVVDDVTGVRYQDAVVLSTSVATGSGDDEWRFLPRLVALDNYILLFYADGTIVTPGADTATGLYARRLAPATPSAWGSETLVVSDLYVRAGVEYLYEFDVRRLTATKVALLYTTGPLFLMLKAVNENLVVDTPAPKLLASALLGIHGLGLAVESTGLRVLATYYDESSATLKGYSVAGSTFADAAGGFTIGALADATRISFIETSPSSFLLHVQPGTTGAIQSATVNTITGAVVGPAPWTRGVVLAGEAFSYDGRSILPVLYVPNYGADGDGVQPTFFLLDASSGRVYLRALGSATGQLVGPGLPRSWATGGSRSVAVPVRGRIRFASMEGESSDVTALGIARLLVSSASPAEFSRLETESGLHIGGACPMFYDGAGLVEDGFHVSPEGATVTPGAGAGGLSPGVYRYAVTYEWTDAQGTLHRSAPSPAVPIDTDALACTSADVTLPFLHLTRKPNVNIVVYRTEANGTIFYRLQAGATVTAPDPITDDSVTINDAVADVDLLSSEVIYTTGGTLDYLPPPAYIQAQPHLEYIAIVPMEGANTVALSLPRVAGEGTAWNPDIGIPMPLGAGDVTALASMEGLMVAFTRSSAFAIIGPGPSAAGSDPFNDIRNIPDTAGCLEWRTVVSVRDGVWHQTPNGTFHFLTRSLTVIQAGDSVEDVDDVTFTRAVHLPTTQEVRFYSEEGRTLVYDYGWGQWSTFTLQPSLDAVVFDGVAHYCTASKIRAEVAGTFTEDGQEYAPLVGTAWISFATLQGFQRVRRWILVGKFHGTTTITTEHRYNYSDDNGAITNHGAITSTTQTGSVFQARHHLAIQKCEAIRMRWTFTSPGQGVSLSGLTLEVGRKKGGVKLGGGRLIR